MSSTVKNSEHTQFTSGAVAVMNGAKGGKSKAANNKRRKEIKTILIDILNSPVTKLPSIKIVADKLGIVDKITVNELLSISVITNTMQRGRLDDIAKLMELVGESNNNENEALDKLCEAINNAARCSNE